MACVTKTLSAQTMGVELPRSGKGTFHFTFSVALQRTGRFFSGVVPTPSVPRQAGQLAARAHPQDSDPTTNAKVRIFIGERVVSRSRAVHLCRLPCPGGGNGANFAAHQV